MFKKLRAGTLMAVAWLLISEGVQGQESDALLFKSKNVAGTLTSRIVVTGNVDLAQVKILNSRLALTPTAQATGAAPGQSSFDLVFSGSAFNTSLNGAVDVSFTARNVVTDLTNQRLEILNNAGTAVAAFLSSGALRFGDGAATGNKVLFANTGSTNLPFIRYNPSTGAWEMSSDGSTTSQIATSGPGGQVVSSLNGLSGAVTLTANTPGLITSSGSTITINDNQLMRLAAAETVTGSKTFSGGATFSSATTFSSAATFSTAPSFTDATPFTITSSTKVTNLNADQLDGMDAAAFVQSLAAGSGIQVSGTMPSQMIAIDSAFFDANFIKMQTVTTQAGVGFNIGGNSLIGGGARITGNVGIGTSGIPTSSKLEVVGTTGSFEVR